MVVGLGCRVGYHLQAYTVIYMLYMHICGSIRYTRIRNKKDSCVDVSNIAVFAYIGTYLSVHLSILNLSIYLQSLYLSIDTVAIHMQRLDVYGKSLYLAVGTARIHSRMGVGLPVRACIYIRVLRDTHRFSVYVYVYIYPYSHLAMCVLTGTSALGTSRRLAW